MRPLHFHFGNNEKSNFSATDSSTDNDGCIYAFAEGCEDYRPLYHVPGKRRAPDPPPLATPPPTSPTRAATASPTAAAANYSRAQSHSAKSAFPSAGGGWER